MLCPYPKFSRTKSTGNQPGILIIRKNLKDCKQVILDLPKHCLIHDVLTRWNSSYEMVEHYLEQQVAIYSALTDKSVKDQIRRWASQRVWLRLWNLWRPSLQFWALKQHHRFQWSYHSKQWYEVYGTKWRNDERNEACHQREHANPMHWPRSPGFL